MTVSLRIIEIDDLIFACLKCWEILIGKKLERVYFENDKHILRTNAGILDTPACLNK
jgi:hypothetical protein